MIVYSDLTQLAQSPADLALSCSVRAGEHVDIVFDCQHIEEVSLPADSLIDRALFHLIRNAISYSADSCEVTVNVKSKLAVPIAQEGVLSEQGNQAPAAVPSLFPLLDLSPLTINDTIPPAKQSLESICFEVSNRSLYPVNEAMLLSRVKEHQRLLQPFDVVGSTSDDALLHRSLSSSKPEGFGLNVVYKVAADALGGFVSCNVSNDGKDVTVTLEIPSVRPRPSSSSEEDATRNSRSKRSPSKNSDIVINSPRLAEKESALMQITEKRSKQLDILVVDDIPSIQKILQRTIESLEHRCRCVCANHGQHALDITTATELLLFDAVFMDL